MKNNVTANQIAKGLLRQYPDLEFIIIMTGGEFLRNASPTATVKELAEIGLTDKIAEICGDPKEASND